MARKGYAPEQIINKLREADILLTPELTARFGCQFLYQSMRRRFDSHVHLLQTDGGPEFKAEFTSNVPLVKKEVDCRISTEN